MDHLHVFTSRLGWFTSHTGESLLPAGPPLKAFMIHKKWHFASVFFGSRNFWVFSTPQKKQESQRFFFLGGRLPKQLRVHASSYWRKAVEEVRCCCVLGSMMVSECKTRFFGHRRLCIRCIYTCSSTWELSRHSHAERCGEILLPCCRQNLRFEVSKCAPEKTFRLSLRCKKRLALSCRTVYEFGVHWNGANTTFEYHKTMCFANPRVSSFLLKPTIFHQICFGKSQFTMSTFPSFVFPWQNASSFCESIDFFALPERFIALSKISSSLKFCLACREAQNRWRFLSFFFHKQNSHVQKKVFFGCKICSTVQLSRKQSVFLKNESKQNSFGLQHVDCNFWAASAGASGHRSLFW